MKKQRTCEEAEEILSKFLASNGINIKFHPENKILFESQNVKYTEKYCYHYCIECGDAKKTKYGYLRDKSSLRCIKCGSKAGSKVTSFSYNKLIAQCTSYFKQRGINLIFSEENNKYFSSQTTNPNNRLCDHTCPYCYNNVKTQYASLKKGEVWCKICRSKKISEKLSYSYEEIMEKVLAQAKEKGIDLKILDDNLEKFNSQTIMTTKKLCYHKCPCCGTNKETTYGCLSRGISYFCKMCVGSINENIFSSIINDLFDNIKNNFKLDSVDYYSKNNKKSIILSDRVLLPDFYADYNGKSIIIEYHGRQHYEAIERWGGKEKLEYQQNRDKELRDHCVKNNIYLLEIDGRNVHVNNNNSFVDFFKSKDSVNIISSFFSLNLDNFIKNYTFKNNMNFYIQRNYDLYEKIVTHYFEDGLSEKKVAEKLGLKKRYVNNIMNLYLNGAFKLKLNKSYSREDYRKNIIKNKKNCLPKGIDNKMSKLNEEKVKEILIRISNGESNLKIAKIYGVTDTCIHSIRNKKTWVNVKLD